MFQMAITKINDVSCGELLNTLLNALTNSLESVGIAWKQCFSGSLHDKLATEYNLSGLPTDLVCFLVISKNVVILHSVFMLLVRLIFNKN